MPTPETTSPAGDPLSALSYEEARDELIRVVGELEQGTTTLEESITLWERGEALARHCEEWLIGAKARLDAARAGSGTASSGTASSGTASSGAAAAPAGASGAFDGE